MTARRPYRWRRNPRPPALTEPECTALERQAHAWIETCLTDLRRRTLDNLSLVGATSRLTLARKLLEKARRGRVRIAQDDFEIRNP